MPRSGLAYEKPSRVARGLVIGFSIAVAVMAGWLAATVMFSHDATTRAADDADLETASTPPYVENIPPDPARPGTAERFGSPFPEPPPRAYAPYSAAAPAPPRSALPLASPAEPPPAGLLGSTFTTTPVPDEIYRGILADEPPRRTEAAVEATDAAPQVVPLPPPRPARTAAIPVPRPRPHLDAEDAQPVADRSFFDFLVNRQR